MKHITWDQYFLGISKLSAMRSKDPNTKVGACIVGQDNRIVGVGYNGFPYGCEDDVFPWENEGDFGETKYPYVVHAELNAILNSVRSLHNCRIYVSLFPCNECAKAIIQSGIKEVIYSDDKYKDTAAVKASKRMFNAAKVSFRQIDDVEVTLK